VATIQQAINQGRQQLVNTVDNPQSEALLLLEHASKLTKEYLIAHNEEPLDAQSYQQYLDYLQRRNLGEPLAYITQIKEFWSLPLSIQPGVLIPRPDTELLVETTLSIANKQSSPTILDLGTGSGCIALALAKELPNAQVTASDNSETCLAIAKQNAEKLNLNNVRFLLSDWFTDISPHNFDIIVSNPPYISLKDKHIEQHVEQFEPQSALFSSNDGYADLDEIIQQAQHYLSAKGTLLVEHGFQQASAVRTLFSANNFSHIHTQKDLQQHERVTYGRIN